jgi:2-succinyl-5-enolpyruvyl-6-hydroxy-3-cyclohexene-1-carboxylate synthase
MSIEWAKQIVEHLVELGVHYFCLSPGSRSTPLAIAIAGHPLARSLVHFDERGMAFHALGYAKASKSPVALLVTSGTAVGNIFPAVMEASVSRIPLILLTADRPPELRDCGANQTADQVKIFQDYVRWQVDLPCPDDVLPAGYLGSTLAQAVYRSTQIPKGPVHVNCMLREPFFTPPSGRSFREATHYEEASTYLPESTILSWTQKLSVFEKGIIVVGALDAPTLEPIYALAEKLDWPILADIISGARSTGPFKQLIPHYELILKTQPDLKPDAILHFGDRFVSKTLLEWMDKLELSFYALVAAHPSRHDPKHLVTHRVVCDPLVFCEAVTPHLVNSVSWCEEWQAHAERIEEQLDECFPPSVSEPGVVRFINDHLPSDWALFLANSMPIRDADNFFFPKRKMGPVFSNRGISGIDGNIATAVGIAGACKRPTLALLGDQTFLHDLNSLAQVKKSEVPVILLIFNNGGGGIFSFLPVAQKTDCFEEYFAGAHSLTFEHAAALFDIPYSRNWEELIHQKHSCIIEVTTCRKENVQLHQQIVQHLLGEHICP